MGHVLTIDQGNSSVKAAIHDGEKILYSCRIKNPDSAQIVAFAHQHEATAAIYCSVACEGDDLVSALGRAGIPCRKLDAGTPLPIVIDYASPTTLGRDRVAAATGAMSIHPGKGLLVVDAGSAITYDVVSPDGHFIGGNIAPGLKMRLQSMHEHTLRLPVVAKEGDTPLWGYDTSTAMRSGAIMGVVAEIAYYRSRLPEDTVIMLTGGDASIVAAYSDMPMEMDNMLVNKGLNRIFQYNENK